MEAIEIGDSFIRAMIHSRIITIICEVEPFIAFFYWHLFFINFNFLLINSFFFFIFSLINNFLDCQPLIICTFTFCSKKICRLILIKSINWYFDEQNIFTMFEKWKVWMKTKLEIRTLRFWNRPQQKPQPQRHRNVLSCGFRIPGSEKMNQK